MSDGFIKWYRARSSVEDFRWQAKVFGAAGIMHVHPTRGVEIMLDVDGNDVELDPGKTARILDLKLGESTMEWWFSPDAGLVCNYGYEPLGCEIQTYYLDGLDASEVAVLERILRSLIENQNLGTLGIVVDRVGRSVEFDWDAVILYSSRTIPNYPDMLALPKEVAEEIEDTPKGMARVQIGSKLVCFEGVQP